MIDLPEELLIYHIFPLLYRSNDPDSLCNEALVCRSWFRCAMAVKWRQVMVGVNRNPTDESALSSSQFIDLLTKKSTLMDYISLVQNVYIAVFEDDADYFSSSDEDDDNEDEEDDSDEHRIAHHPDDMEIEQIIKLMGAHDSLPALRWLTIQARSFVDLKHICISPTFQRNLEALLVSMNSQDGIVINIDMVSKLRNLRQLDFAYAAVPSEALAHIIQPNLTSLQIGCLVGYADNSFTLIADMCPDLRRLFIYPLQKPGSLTNDCLDYLITKCKNLVNIEVLVDTSSMNNEEPYMPIFKTMVNHPQLETIILHAELENTSTWYLVAKYFQDNMASLRRFVVNSENFHIQRDK